MSEFTATAPGRVNLIGEHTDYNGGMVLPAALSVSLAVTLTPREDDAVNVTANDYPDTASRQLSDRAQDAWSDPCVGALQEARVLGLLSGGADVSIQSSIPQGAGLSSSAALIVAVLKAARSAAGGMQSDVDLAVAARRVENDYMGVPCGIMDQMAVALATPGTAMALDTKALEYSLVPLPTMHELVVLHSGVTRKLTEGRYAIRKEECDTAKAHFGTDDLCLLEPETIRDSTLEEPAKSRALHCATEHLRVVDAAKALETGDMDRLGALMNESHVSMRDLFDMSLPAIDALVTDAAAFGAVGARLTGGGFGGCIVALLENGTRDEWLAKITAAHPEARFIDAASG
ncbi:MAG: galactokinase [Erythrobacter sp.]